MNYPQNRRWIKMFENQIEEVEKGCGKKINCGNFHLYCGDSGMYKLRLCPKCQTKLSTLKECQAKFNQQEESKGILKGVVENIIKKGKEDLSEPINYFWSNYYNKDKPIGWYDLYQFLDCLEIMKYQGEKVIEAKEGHTCVVEKTRDKYLKDECIRFLDLINKSAQQKFDKFKQKVKELLIQHTNLCIQQNKVEIAGYLSGFHTELDELSSKEGEDE
jgi:hypothetical protein